VDEHQLNPKAGVVWQVLPTTKIRLAGFRAFKRSLASNQTLEPTQVAGFNQFFDDPTASDASRYGIGFDHALSRSFTVGAELTRRKLIVPIVDPALVTIREDDQQQRADRIYLHWLPTERFGVAAEYYDERFERDLPSTDLRSPSQLFTKWAPLTLMYSHPNGLFGKVRASYVTQEIESSAVGHREDSFWVSDLSLGYRLPRRYGSVSLIIKNLFNETFSFHDVDFQNGTIPRVLYQPERAVFLRFSLGL